MTNFELSSGLEHFCFEKIVPASAPASHVLAEAGTK